MSASASAILLATTSLMAAPDSQARYGVAESLGVVHGSAAQEQLGHSITLIGDVDGDGYRELVASGFWGGVRCLDGRTGQPQWAFTGSTAFGNEVVTADDIDGDGIEDWVAMDGSLGGSLRQVHVCAAADGSVLRTIAMPGAFDVPIMVRSCADRDGDGIRDLMIAASNGGGNVGQVHFVSPVSGAFLQTVDARCQESVYAYSSSAELLDDIDGDGVEDFAFSNIHDDWNGHDQAGVVYVRSGATGDLLYALGGEEPIERLGRSLHRTGDLDGDGIGDLLVESDGGAYFPLPGFASVHSPARGIELYRVALHIDGYPWRPGFCTVPDADGDGVDDFMLGSALRSGVDGRLMHHFLPPPSIAADSFGDEVAIGNDLDGDGFRELVFGAPRAGYGAQILTGAVSTSSFHPGIRAQRRVVHALAPVPVEFILRFPADQVGNPYRVLASLAPAGATSTIGGFTLPLGTSPLLDRAMGAAPLPWLEGGHGFVPWPARASATAALPAAALLPAIGATVRFAVVTHPAGAPAWSSVSVPVTVLP